MRGCVGLPAFYQRRPHKLSATGSFESAILCLCAVPRCSRLVSDSASRNALRETTATTLAGRSQPSRRAKHILLVTEKHTLPSYAQLHRGAPVRAAIGNDCLWAAAVPCRPAWRIKIPAMLGWQQYSISPA